MSLFIGTLAFDDAALLNGVRLGDLMGSIASGILGFVLLRVFCKSDSAITEAKNDPITV